MTKIIEKQFTADELAILRSLSNECKWIARDESGELAAYDKKPIKDLKQGFWNVHPILWLDQFIHSFECIQWSDEDPMFINDYVYREE